MRWGFGKGIDHAAEKFASDTHDKGHLNVVSGFGVVGQFEMKKNINNLISSK